MIHIVHLTNNVISNKVMLNILLSLTCKLVTQIEYMFLCIERAQSGPLEHSRVKVYIL